MNAKTNFFNQKKHKMIARAANRVTLFNRSGDAVNEDFLATANGAVESLILTIRAMISRGNVVDARRIVDRLNNALANVLPTAITLPELEEAENLEAISNLFGNG